MKPKPSEFIPIYGIKYFKRYFKEVTKSTKEDVWIANYMFAYHSLIPVIMIMIILVIIDYKIK